MPEDSRSSRSITVRFAVDCSSTSKGQHVRVVGAHPVLGAWRPEDSTVVLRTCPEEFPFWSSDDVALTEAEIDDIEDEYKYVICDEGGVEVKWEASDMRHLPPALDSPLAGTLSPSVAIREVFNASETERQTSTGTSCTTTTMESTTISSCSSATTLGGTVRVQFAVECRAAAEQGDRMFVVGSLPELGAWAPDSTMVEMYTNEQDFPVWRSGWVDVTMTALIALGYKYAIGRSSGGCECDNGGVDSNPLTFVWEDRVNRELAAPASELESVAVADIFNDDADKDGGRKLLARFAVECKDTLPGDRLVVVGSAPELGGWNPDASRVSFRTGLSDFPVWRSGWLLMDADALATPEMRLYKYVIIHKDGKHSWEDRPNRELPWKTADVMRLGVLDAYGASTDGSYFFEQSPSGAVGNDLFFGSPCIMGKANTAKQTRSAGDAALVKQKKCNERREAVSRLPKEAPSKQQVEVNMKQAVVFKVQAGKAKVSPLASKASMANVMELTAVNLNAMAPAPSEETSAYLPAFTDGQIGSSVCRLLSPDVGMVSCGGQWSPKDPVSQRIPMVRRTNSRSGSLAEFLTEIPWAGC